MELISNNNYNKITFKKRKYKDKLNDKKINNISDYIDCKSIVKTYYNKNIDRNDNNNNNYNYKNGDSKYIEQIKLSYQSVYFHLNENLLHDFSDLTIRNNNRSSKIIQPCSLENKNQNEKINFEDESFYRDKNLLLIGCGSIKRLPVLLSIKKLPLNRLVCLATNQTWAHEYIDEWIFAEHENIDKKDETIKAIDKYVKENNIQFHAVITYDDLCTILTSYLSQHYNLPGIPYDISAKIKNKFEFRLMSKKLGINCPNFFMIKSAERVKYLNELKVCDKDKENQEFVKIFNFDEPCKYPVIVKNTYGVGKDFVKKCTNSVDLTNAIEDSLKLNQNMDLLIEEFFDGHEIDCEVLIQDNKVKLIIISDNFPPLEPFFFEQGGITPSIELTSNEYKAIERILTEWITKLNFNNACLHFEARCRPQSIYKKNNFDENSNLVDETYFLMPIEINLRLAGAETWSMVKASFDIDLIKEVVNIGLGLELNENELQQKLTNPRFRSVSKDFHPAKNVLIDSISINLNKLMQIDHAVEVSIFRSVGDKLTVKDYVGWVSVINDKNSYVNDLNAKLNEVLSCIEFKFTDY